MDGFMYHMMYGYPFRGLFLGLGIAWIIQLIVAIIVYRDAKDRQLNPILWFILIILPVIGWLFLVIYVIIRETRHSPILEKEQAAEILDKRFAKGEITADEYRTMKEEMKK